MKVAVVGTGYVGLVTGTCFAEVGIDVVCIDIDKEKIDNLNKGILPIWEPGLDKLVKRNFEAGRLTFSTSLKKELSGCEVIFSAVGTPPDEDGSADLQYVLSVAREVGQNMEDYALIVTKSTVPVGTAAKVKTAIQEELDKRGSDLTFDVASNPEFLKEGDAVNDFMKPDRIVVGVESERAKDLMNKLYKPFTMSGHPVIYMSVPSAEMTKYTANAMLATKISFMNDIANLCEILGADVGEVRKGIGSDRRIGQYFIYPGIGYGGSCFPKDVKALIKTASEVDYDTRVLKAVEEVNDDQKKVLFNKVNTYFKGNLKGKKLAFWGLSFKPQTDDMREAPSLVLIDLFTKAGAEVIAYDPVAMEECQRKIGDQIKYAEDQYAAAEGADAVLLITEWMEFRVPDFDRLKGLLNNAVIFDGRNQYNGRELKAKGYDYFDIGHHTI